MRLSNLQVEAIKQSVREVFGHEARVMLFGSRLDDSAKGGDIDLLVCLDTPVEESAWDVARLQAKIIKRIGDRKIDVILDTPSMIRQPIHNIARAQGILL